MLSRGLFWIGQLRLREVQGLVSGPTMPGTQRAGERTPSLSVTPALAPSCCRGWVVDYRRWPGPQEGGQDGRWLWAEPRGRAAGGEGRDGHPAVMSGRH